MTEPPRIWKTGERCRITFEGRTVDGHVALASPNGRSLFLTFEALLGGYAGGMPVSWLPDGTHFCDLIKYAEVGIDPTPEESTT